MLLKSNIVQLFTNSIVTTDTIPICIRKGDKTK